MSRPDRDEREGTVVPFPGTAGPAERETLQSAERYRSTDTFSAGEPDAEIVPVDPEPRRPTVGERLALEQQWRPILPKTVTDKATRQAYERWFLARLAHRVALHSLHSPWYALQTVWFVLAGIGRAGRALWRWVTDAEAVELRKVAARSAVSTGGKAELDVHSKLERERQERCRPRRVLLAVAALGAGAGYVGLQFVPPWATWTVAAALYVVLAYVGRPLTRPWIPRAVVSAEVPPLTSNAIIAALGVLGIGELNKALAKEGERAVRFVEQVARDGAGYRAVVDLPLGVTVTQVMDRREQLASGLRRPLGCCWPLPAGVDEHSGKLVLYVADQDMRKARQEAWPLARAGTADLFAPQPFGTDQAGRWVNLTLMFTSAVIGAVPRMGKTFALRELLLIAALDPRAQLHAYDLKGTGDLSPLEPVCHRYGVGDEPEEITAALADMRALQDELRRRTKVIRSLPRDLCPENKVTPELAGKRSLGLHPIVVGVDECQQWFEHPKHGGEFEAICTDVVKRGPAVGMLLILATQRPDSNSIPTGISANATLRFCLKVMTHIENDMVLGGNRHKAGVRATQFAFEQKGIGYLVGDGADAQIVRTVNIDAPAAEKIAARARRTREQAGNITGHAAGEAPDVGPGFDLLADVRTVFATAERLHSQTVCERLAELRPGVYAGLEPKALAAALSARGITTKQLWIGGNNRYGLELEQLGPRELDR